MNVGTSTSLPFRLEEYSRAHAAVTRLIVLLVFIFASTPSEILLTIFLSSYFHDDLEYLSLLRLVSFIFPAFFFDYASSNGPAYLIAMSKMESR